MSPAELLVRLARRYRIERALAPLLQGLGAALLIAGLAYRAGGDRLAMVLLGSLALEAAALTAWWTDWLHPVNAVMAARHLDRLLPDMEESSALLLAPAGTLGTLAELQRRRIAARWDPTRARATLPHVRLRRAAIVGALLALAGIVLLLLPKTRRGLRTVWSGGEGGVSITLRQLDVEVRPPAYTGEATRNVSGADIEVEEGALLTWRLQTAGPVAAAWLIPSTGDSIGFVSDGPGAWRLARRADHSLLLRIRLRTADGLALASDDYRLAVRPDRPPVVTIVRPQERSSFPPGRLPPVPVEVLATDDYGVDAADISATIATGRGEAVRFRRLRLPFASRTGRENHGELFRTTLDLRALGLGPGDELYFTVEARDRRAPEPNRARSETVFITVQDTAQAPRAELAALALGVQPEYFRSERQLIMDTEKLLADQHGLSPVSFRERSNDLGMDQGLLRLRYGQFLGEEFEEAVQPMGGREHAAEEAKEPAAPEEKAPTAGEKRESAGEKAADPYTHKHDEAENATLLGRSVKQTLKAAVAAMWQAELQLRIGEPRRALPWEYRALDLIKRVQQDSRAYVQRVGFDPPPIEVDRLRLTGKLDGIGDRRLVESVSPRDSLPAVRVALAALAGYPDTAAGDAGRLEAAGRELAALALVDPRLLPVLRDLRQLADSLRRQAPCPGCAARVEQALWRALPPAEPRPDDASPGSSPFARRFARLLGEARR
jgi:hypothetical protein